jgi:hypothetical protein
MLNAEYLLKSFGAAREAIQKLCGIPIRTILHARAKEPWKA